MPPQTTNITSEGDAARLGLDVPVALTKDASGEALVVRLSASIAAPGAALPEKDAAGPATASTRSILGLLARYWRAFQERRQRHHFRAALADLSDRDLRDLGLTRGEIDYLTSQRAIDRIRDNAYLWSRGVM